MRDRSAPNLVRSPERLRVLERVARAILALDLPHFVTRVAIDGVDGAGKTVFADELAAVLRARGREVIRASVDAFHHRRAVRYRLGRDSPEGFFRDSYNYPLLKARLLDPLSPAGSGRYRTAAFDHRSDCEVAAPEQQAAPGSILLFDGIFLHRPELLAYWDYSVFLRVPFGVSIPRGAQRGEGAPDPLAASNRRYLEGQQRYLRSCTPEAHAGVVIDNTLLERPRIVAGLSPA